MQEARCGYRGNSRQQGAYPKAASCVRVVASGGHSPQEVQYKAALTGGTAITEEADMKWAYRVTFRHRQ